MIVSATEMLKKAVEGKYAVGQFNINNLEWTKAILLTAQENNSPKNFILCVFLSNFVISILTLILYKNQKLSTYC